MGPITRVIQTGIGLAAELKAATKGHEASEAAAEESSTGKHGWSPPVEMSRSPVRTRQDQVPTQIEQPQIREGKERDDLDDEDEDDEHFGDVAISPDKELEIGELEDMPPPYTED